MQASVENIDDMSITPGLPVILRLFGTLGGTAIGSAAFTLEFQKRSPDLPQYLPPYVTVSGMRVGQ
jgi:carbamoylphosphate synthase large subunit